MARVGLRFASIGHSVSLVWPPTGIALGALAILGYRFWPGIALGAFLANAASPVPLPTAAAIAVGNTLEGLVAAFLLRRSAGSTSTSRGRTVAAHARVPGSAGGRVGERHDRRDDTVDGGRDLRSCHSLDARGLVDG